MLENVVSLRSNGFDVGVRRPADQSRTAVPNRYGGCAVGGLRRNPSLPQLSVARNYNVNFR